jgi:prevent-host-death family protein
MAPVHLSLKYPYYTDNLRLLVSKMVRISAVEFQRKFGDFQHHAQREPVEITRHGRRELVLMSAEHYDLLKAAAQRSDSTADASVGPKS